MDAGAPCSTQGAAEEVFRIFEVRDEVDLPAALWMVFQQSVQEAQGAEILERETHRVEDRHLFRMTAPGLVPPHDVREFDHRKISGELLYLPFYP